MTKLYSMRIQKNKTQKEVSICSEITIRHYQYIEAGEKVPTVYIALRIAKALGVTVEEIF